MSIVPKRQKSRHILFSKHKNRFLHCIGRGGVISLIFLNNCFVVLSHYVKMLRGDYAHEYRGLFIFKTNKQTTGITVFKDILTAHTIFSYYYCNCSHNTENLECHLFYHSQIHCHKKYLHFQIFFIPKGLEI